MSRYLPPDPACPQCREVIQICRTDGATVSDCRQIPVDVLVNGASPSLAEMMPALLACGGLMAVAWVFKTVVKTLLKE